VSKAYEVRSHAPLMDADLRFSRTRDILSSVHSIELACHHVETPLQRLEHALHPWVPLFLVVPLFALANMGLTIIAPDLSQDTAVADDVRNRRRTALRQADRDQRLFLSLCASRIRLFASGVSWPQIFGVSVLGGNRIHDGRFFIKRVCHSKIPYCSIMPNWEYLQDPRSRV